MNYTNNYNDLPYDTRVTKYIKLNNIGVLLAHFKIIRDRNDHTKTLASWYYAYTD